MVRTCVVNQLVSAANEGMLRGLPQGTTQDEVFSAYMTMALRAVRVGKASGANMEQFRNTLQLILMECADEHAGN